jgi:hypothetical protein
MTILDVHARWLERLFYQWQDSPNILALIEIFSDPFQDSVDVCEFLLNSIGIDDGEGVQLDWIGEIIGVERPQAQETRIFTLCRLGEVQDPDKSFADESDPTVTIGGYMGTLRGLVDQDDPDALMSDADYRRLLKQKAQSFRSKMTRLNFFNYLLAFGARSKIEVPGALEVEGDPIRYDDLTHWERWYIETKGFRPAGVRVEIRERLRNEDSI